MAIRPPAPKVEVIITARCSFLVECLCFRIVAGILSRDPSKLGKATIIAEAIALVPSIGKYGWPLLLLPAVVGFIIPSTRNNIGFAEITECHILLVLFA